MKDLRKFKKISGDFETYKLSFNLIIEEESESDLKIDILNKLCYDESSIRDSLLMLSNILTAKSVIRSEQIEIAKKSFNKSEQKYLVFNKIAGSNLIGSLLNMFPMKHIANKEKKERVEEISEDYDVSKLDADLAKVDTFFTENKDMLKILLIILLIFLQSLQITLLKLKLLMSQ